jgi:tetratricopeptide (TPR) repeat protein
MTGFFQSVSPLQPQIIVINIGANKECIDLCEANGAEIYRPYDQDHLGDIRNETISKGSYEYQMFMHPWETILQGWDQLKNLNKRAYNIPILHDALMSKEARLWKVNTGIKFVNPVCEHLNEKTSEYLHCVLSSTNEYDVTERLHKIRSWKQQNVNISDPYYYLALGYLTLGDYPNFLKTSTHYMHINTNKSMSSTMNKYYFALVNTYITKSFKPALQNIAQCLEVNPLMAEFWCLAGDVQYYLLKKFDKARHLYDNAIILGSQRKQDDTWPMDISKYQEYPEKMIKSCDDIVNNKSYFVR